MDSSMSVPSHVKAVAAIFICFIIFQFYFQSSVRSSVSEPIIVTQPSIDSVKPSPEIILPETAKENNLISTKSSLRQKIEEVPKNEIVETVKSSVKNDRKRCGGYDHAKLTRPCAGNDTNCGVWDDRYWKPTSCEYQDISSEQARKCLGGRTLAFIGDSQIRDLAVGVSLLLLGKKLESSSKFRVDHKLNNHMDVNGTKMPDFELFKKDNLSLNSVSYLFPQPEVAKSKGYKWQVQYYAYFRRKGMMTGLNHILNNKLQTEWKLLKPITLAFLSYGLQDYGWWNKEQQYGEKYFGVIIAEWASSRRRKVFTVPSVWIPMNSQCYENLKTKGGAKGQLPAMIDEISAYVNIKTLKEKIPYWDASAVLRTQSPDRCELLDDGIHVKMYVDIMRAKMLFNHLCDSDMNWVGGVNTFI